MLFKLLKTRGTLVGKKVAVLAQASSEPAVKSVILPGLKSIGASTGTAAYLTVSGADTTAAQAQLSSFIERWKSENVNALYVTGEDVSSQQFIEKVTQQMPGIQLLTDVGDMKTFGQDETKAGINPNPYQGVLIANGFSPHDYDQSANWKYCAAIYKKYIGQDAPDAETKVPGPDGKQLDTNGNINDACQSLSLFHDVATRVGQIPQRRQLGGRREHLRSDREPRRRSLRVADARASTTSTTHSSCNPSTRRSHRSATGSR